MEQLADAFKTLRMPHELMEKLIAHLKQGVDMEKDVHRAAIVQIRKEYDLAKQKLDNALDYLLSKSITKEEYDAIVPKLRQRLHQLNHQLEGHTKADESFAKTVTALLELASRAYESFLSSEIEEKRQLMGFVFSNLKIKGNKLEYSMRKPFDTVAKLPNLQEWLRDLDSNQGPSD